MKTKMVQSKINGKHMHLLGFENVLPSAHQFLHLVLDDHYQHPANVQHCFLGSMLESSSQNCATQSKSINSTWITMFNKTILSWDLHSGHF